MLVVAPLVPKSVPASRIADCGTRLAEFSSLDDIIGRLKCLTILGSTGSIGVSTLDVVGRHPDQYRVHALVAGHNVDVLVGQILQFRPRIVVTATDEARQSLISWLSGSGLPKQDWPDLEFGSRARVDAATGSEVDFVMSAIKSAAKRS